MMSRLIKFMLPRNIKTFLPPNKTLDTLALRKLYKDKIIIIPSAKKMVTYKSKLAIDTENHLVVPKTIGYDDDFVVRLERATVWGSRGAVVTSDGALLIDQAREFGLIRSTDHTIFSKFLLKKPKVIEKTVAVVTTAGSNVYYHWLFDVLPRIGLLESAKVTQKIDLWVIDYKGLPFQYESLNILGISQESIINCDKNWEFHIEANTVWTTSLSSKINEISPFACAYLRKKFLSTKKDDAVQKRKSRIYISRKLVGNRLLINEDEIFAVLSEKYGFELVNLEDHPFHEQVNIFSNIEMVVGPHGSGFSNIVFSNPGTLAIDIQPSTFPVTCFLVLANIVGVEYVPIVGEGIPAINGNKKHDNVHIEMEHLEKIIQNHLKRS